MAQQLGYLSLALYMASFLCYGRNLYLPSLWIGRLATLLPASGIVVQYFSLYQRSLVLKAVPYEIVAGAFHVIRGTFIAPGAEAEVMVIWVDALRPADALVPAEAT